MCVCLNVLLMCCFVLLMSVLLMCCDIGERQRECARVEPVSSPCGETRLFQQFSVLCALRVLNNIFIFILSLPLDGITHATYCSCHVLLIILLLIVTYYGGKEWGKFFKKKEL